MKYLTHEFYQSVYYDYLEKKFILAKNEESLARLKQFGLNPSTRKFGIGTVSLAHLEEYLGYDVTRLETGCLPKHPINKETKSAFIPTEAHEGKWYVDCSGKHHTVEIIPDCYENIVIQLGEGKEVLCKEFLAIKQNGAETELRVMLYYPKAEKNPERYISFLDFDPIAPTYHDQPFWDCGLVRGIKKGYTHLLNDWGFCEVDSLIENAKILAGTFIGNGWFSMKKDGSSILYHEDRYGTVSYYIVAEQEGMLVSVKHYSDIPKKEFNK